MSSERYNLVPSLTVQLAELRAERDELKDKLAALRAHALTDDSAFRVLHENAALYLDAVEALAEIRDGAPLSTTIGWLIRQGYLVPSDSKAAR